MNQPTQTAREIIANTRALAKASRDEAARLHYVLARRAESRALLRIASASETFASRLEALTDTAEHARPLLVDET